MELGRLNKVELREAWKSEAIDFTPWLAEENNLTLLGDTIGIELELEATEKDVGPFRADILCRDTTDGHWVLIENQLERTDHTHLGQIITYAAGLKAVSTVWIARKFTDEHRAAIDWLNEVTGDRINFFGLEVELWKIGDSPVAPKFNVVCKPNDWSRRVSGGAGTGEISETRKMQQEFWAGLSEFLEERGTPLKSQKPLPQNWAIFAIGRSNFYLNATINKRDNRFGCELIITEPNAKAHFSLLEEDREAIESEIGTTLEWRERGQNSKGICLYKDVRDVTDREKWPEFYDWFAKWLTTFYNVFRPRIRSLNADDYHEQEN